MDEPTSGLEARAVAIVTRTIRNTVETGRIDFVNHDRLNEPGNHESRFPTISSQEDTELSLTRMKIFEYFLFLLILSGIIHGLLVELSSGTNSGYVNKTWIKFVVSNLLY
ncbi:ABC transporter G family member 42-like [Iris pallida]|uniref:ABC transporter G family member 42-like n=1 Tax=Iris pallida TaxID=29817 RepID=A0AAX6FLT0_IRIPA|nr:ABC transporter G family member 42-like [Iris pallida]